MALPLQADSGLSSDFVETHISSDTDVDNDVFPDTPRARQAESSLPLVNGRAKIEAELLTRIRQE